MTDDTINDLQRRLNEASAAARTASARIVELKRELERSRQEEAQAQQLAAELNRELIQIDIALAKR